MTWINKILQSDKLTFATVGTPDWRIDCYIVINFMKKSIITIIKIKLRYWYMVSEKGIAWNTTVSNRNKLQDVLFIVSIIMTVLTHIERTSTEISRDSSHFQGHDKMDARVSEEAQPTYHKRGAVLSSRKKMHPIGRQQDTGCAHKKTWCN
jgi:hypothetical protein